MTPPGRGIDRGRLAAALNAIEADGGEASGQPFGPSAEASGLVEAAWHAPRGLVVGVTGPPGVGKSTLAGRLVAAWRSRGLTVGALCIDPSSRRSGGALLGDRLRMRLSGDDPDVFVRSLAARGQLGGLAPRAFEAMTVLRAAVDRVLVETVGVGQSEIEISRGADLTAVVIQPGSGDALQFLKAGLMEVFDLLVVNKADLGALAENAARELRSALRVQGRREVPVVTLSAEQNTGVDALMAVIETNADAADERFAARREVALRETLFERFARWHGERQVKALGGRAMVMATLEAVADASPARLAHTLESLAKTPMSGGQKRSQDKPWVGEVEVDSALARTLVTAVAPELTDVLPEPLGSGWDNTAWLFRESAEDAWVFRFPRRTLAVGLLARELELMPRVAQHLPLPVTAARWRGSMGNGWPFGGYRFLTGDVAAIAGLDDADKLALAPIWGGFLRALHALDPATLELELPIDPLGKVDVARRWDVTLATLASTGSSSEGALRVLEGAREVWQRAGPRPRVLCHGDLDARHLIVVRGDGPIRASGVIDWGDMMLGDPAIDLGVAFSFLEGPAREAFFDVYGEIDPATEAFARFRAVASQVWLLSWANDIGHAEHAAEARRGLARATR